MKRKLLEEKVARRGGCLERMLERTLKGRGCRDDAPAWL